MGGYAFCEANGLKLLKFELQDEHDKFKAYLDTKSAYFKAILGTKYRGTDGHFYFGSYSKTPGKSTGWIWYDNGEPDTTAYIWHAYQPDNWQNAEWCLDMCIYGTLWAINDLPCNDYGQFRTSFFCQETTYATKKTNGMSPKYI